MQEPFIFSGATFGWSGHAKINFIKCFWHCNVFVAAPSVDQTAKQTTVLLLLELLFFAWHFPVVLRDWFVHEDKLFSLSIPV